MGLFDSLKKILETAENVAKTVASEAAAPETSDSGLYPDAPAKPSVKRTTTFFGGPEGDDAFDVSFMLSGDFIEFNSHCELDPAYQYEPDNDEDYTEYKEGLPSIFFGPFDPAYTAAQKYEASRALPNADCETVENDAFFYKGMFDYYGQAMYAYVFAAGTPMEYQVLALTYDRKCVGTPLEQKLKAALDEAAATYTETKAE